MFRILNHTQKNHFYANKKSFEDITIEICVFELMNMYKILYMYLTLTFKHDFFQMFIDSNRKKRR